jgi:hypothetical protein
MKIEENKMQTQFIEPTKSPEKEENQKIILLDLNYTLVANSDEIPRLPFMRRFEQETYDEILIDLIKDEYVILITARPDKHQTRTNRRIKEMTGFVPHESYYNYDNLQPHILKEKILLNKIFPVHGEDINQYHAIESNQVTRRMYHRHGIKAEHKHDYKRNKEKLDNM